MKNHSSNSNFFYGDSRNAVITWDDKQTDYYPQVKILNLDNFNNFSIRLDEEKTWGSKHTFTRDGIEAGRSSKSFLENKNCKNECYTTSDLFEWLIYLKKKPTTNKVYFSVNTKNAEFLPQGPLTEQEVAEGCVRPDEIVGSLAVYSPFRNHILGDLNHMAGKIGHIPAPYVILKDASKVKCDMYFEDSWLVIEIPLTVYNDWDWKEALILDPTFGYSSVGGSEQNISIGYVFGSKDYTMSEAGEMTSISWYIGGSASYNINYGIYTGTDMLRETGQFIPSTADFSWQSKALSSNLSLASSDVIRFAAIGTNYAFIKAKLDTGTTGDKTYYSAYSYITPLPDPITWTDGVNRLFSCYGTYTAAASSSIKKYLSVAQASIKKANTVAVASIKKINTVANS